ncbi:MAG: excinuclease ABC subunit UvrA [Planctomycetota bacterium]
MPVAKKKAAGRKKKAGGRAAKTAAVVEPKLAPGQRPTGGPAQSDAYAERLIRVRGAKEHNLKNIDVELPRDKLVVVTGLSGSGKSSLAFDTLFAEGQRKYMESLSAYARQFLDQLKKPDVEEVEGIPPTIAIEQRSSSHNPRSTVATTTEIYDYLRLLFARCGTAYSWAPTKTKKDGTVLARSGKPIAASSASQIVDAVMKWDEGTRMLVLAPLVRGKKGFHKDVFERLVAQGWGRARVNGDVIDLRDALKEGGENPLNLGRYHKHDIEAVVDRIVIRPDDRQRLAESVESALRLAEGSVVLSVETRSGEKSTWTDHGFSEKFADPDNPEYALDEVSPRLFSFNSPFGACPTCHGLGAILEFDEELVVPDPDKTIGRGGIAPWKKNGPGGMIYPKFLRRFCRAFGVDQSTPMGELDDETYRILLHGTDAEDEAEWGVSWDGVIPMLHAWFEKTESTWAKDHLHQFQSERVCPTCTGDRLRIEALHVLLESTHAADTSRAFSETVIGRPGGRNDGTILNISELSRLNINDAVAFVEGLVLTEEQQKIAEPILREIGNRLRFLSSVGLEYLSLDRRTATLSGGEAQRIRLATQVGSGLVGACYVLDEPTIGLHQRDNDRLIRTLRHLSDIGNTVIVVEHDEDMIRAADHVLDIGPGPGVHGGEVVAQGTVDEICGTAGSLTGDYLAGRKRIDVPPERRTVAEKKAITVKGAKANNLRSIDVSFPLGGFVCVTGVSGSGKSTLVNEILLKSLRRHLLGSRDKPGAHTRVNGLNQVDRVIEVDQSPIGRTPRSNPATYTGVFDDIRKVFTQSKEAKIRGYKPGRFSFNVSAQKGGGRCEACQGQGLKRIEMHFLPDVFVECEVCKGKRYNRETLEVLYRGKSIADVLDMTVEDACSFFENHPKILRFVECLRDVGLGYITLGQPSTTLSGGEAQRIKLATELGKGVRYDGTPSTEHTLYILDEPTTGLHFEDIRKLVGVLNRLADAGNTLVVIEHNLDVIKCADWLLDMGPEGGDGGGTLVASGSPEAVAKSKTSHTGRYLKSML